MKINILLLSGLIFCTGTLFGQINMNQSTPAVTSQQIGETLKQMEKRFGTNPAMAKGVEQVAAFWENSDGTPDDFTKFCTDNYAGTDKDRKTLYDKLSTAFETLLGGYSTMDIRLKMPLHVDGPAITPVDEMFGAYSVYAHFADDMFANKIAFVTMLNFPFITLNEKNEAGQHWSRLEWAYARMGDLFTERVPAALKQVASAASSAAENYIAGYNIMMGHVVGNDGKKLFPDGMKLLSHWNLRDELKSDYADKKVGIEKQKTIYTIMKRIVDQSIPKQVIDNPSYDWNPYSNQLWKDGQPAVVEPENNRRYQILFNQFVAQRNIDAHDPLYPSYISRSFEQGMEFTRHDVEEIFISYLTSPQVKKVAALISKRLGRKLQPFDIWYDGFKTRSTIPEDELTAKTRKLYPAAAAYGADMVNILTKLGFTSENARRIASNVAVDPARGSGHAMGTDSRTDKVRLRTRVGTEGMDYKGYNIATHEFGHNVEQTISLHDVDYYMLRGVPNTAHTEALAFVFQRRDLDLLGYTQDDAQSTSMQTLDTFWDVYEIMGVSLVDIYSWNWLYEHPDATVDMLKDAVIRCARDVWNKYYEPVLGDKDSPILAIYSHMINDPLYLPNYPFGFLIQFQLEQHFTKATLASEIERIYSQGRLTPRVWMKGAVGSAISAQPLLDATEQALSQITKSKPVSDK
jgi:hypothetical protein